MDRTDTRKEREDDGKNIKETGERGFRVCLRGMRGHLESRKEKKKEVTSQTFDE